MSLENFANDVLIIKEMTRKEMMDDIISLRGHEDPVTIWFCGMAEDNRFPDTVIHLNYISALTAPVSYTENEEG